MIMRLGASRDGRSKATSVRRLLAVVGVLVLVAAACGDDDGDSAEPDETTASSDGASSGTDDAAEATVRIENFSFGEPVSISEGGTVLVENADGTTHTLTADDESFDTGNIAPGSSAELTLDESGTFSFHCEIHSSMTGTITVGGDVATSDADDAAADGTSDAAPTGPAEIAASDQQGDGSEVVIDSVSLPASGYIVVHADADGAPGMILGHTELLPEGTSTDVVVELDVPLESTATVWPMAHIDANGNAVYEFAPPDETTDVPATLDSGEVAVVPITVTIG